MRRARKTPHTYNKVQPKTAFTTALQKIRNFFSFKTTQPTRVQNPSDNPEAENPEYPLLENAGHIKPSLFVTPTLTHSRSQYRGYSKTNKKATPPSKVQRYNAGSDDPRNPQSVHLKSHRQHEPNPSTPTRLPYHTLIEGTDFEPLFLQNPDAWLQILQRFDKKKIADSVQGVQSLLDSGAPIRNIVAYLVKVLQNGGFVSQKSPTSTTQRMVLKLQELETRYWSLGTLLEKWLTLPKSERDQWIHRARERFLSQHYPLRFLKQYSYAIEYEAIRLWCSMDQQRRVTDEG